MKRTFILALVAALALTGSAFAQRHAAAPLLTFTPGVGGAAAGPTTTNNDDTCDIGTAPAATLLLPYFEVDLSAARSTTTLFTITNVSRYPQIAHVTVWTDWSFPVLDFNIFLTGYDVQPINLLDVLSGTVAPPSGTSFIDATHPTPGAISANNTSNNNIQFANGPCTNLPGTLPANLVAAVRTALTTGVYNPGPPTTACSTAGGVHPNAIGYVTIDVAADCSTKFPSDPTYYDVGTGEILFDNVLIGDYQQLGPAAAGTVASSFDGAGNPMVHIRAVPEGGGAGIGTNTTAPGTNLPYTFYDRYTPSTNRTIDRRQPLPASFAARYIQGGTGAFATNFKIWREGVTGQSSTACSAYINNGVLPIGEIIRFDEHEVPSSLGGGPTCSPCNSTAPTLPETSATNTASGIYPALGGSDVGGWMYLNLTNGDAAGTPPVTARYSVTGHPSGTITTAPNSSAFGNVRNSQNWVVIEMFGNVGSNRLSVDFDAAWLGNGCSGPIPVNGGSTAPSAAPGPAGGVFVCPPSASTGVTVNMTNGTTTQCTGTNVTPNNP